MAGYRGGGESSGGGGETVSSQSFSNATTVRVFHSLSYKPAVWIVLTDGTLISSEVVFSAAFFTVNFCVSLSGSVFFR